jgi:lipopolysaccharide/colanic/teichoic acid biosynthesis glycosyltransferase
MLKKRVVDLIVVVPGLIIISPLLIIIFILIKLDSKGNGFYLQTRVGRNNKDFKIIKFRTMKTGSDKKGLLTIGGNDSRITKIGSNLRKYKLDELPQLFNVLKGDMSLVGPRPEVRKYVDLYSKEQLSVLNIKPGITDYASLIFFSESDLLAQSNNPEQTYIQEIMPEKLRINLIYLNQMNTLMDFKIVLKTILKIIK